ncbi:MAG: cell surface protein SprA [Candidatus Latescibacteria bacterium]|nr:cell surface protein SprA [Candidatus Latescibacterota bacterium]
MASRSHRIAAWKPAVLLVCFCTGFPAPAASAQEEGPVRGRVGVREYLLAGVYDNMTTPWVPRGRLPSPAPLGRRGLHLIGAMPGFSQRVVVQPGHAEIYFQTLYGTREVQRPAVVGFEEYLERVSGEQARRMLLAGFFESQKVEEEGERGLLEFEIPITIPRGLSSVVGEGGAGLRVSGNRRIRFSGRSEWTEGAVSTATAYTSKFPALNMEQDSRFQIVGSVGSKIEVSVEQDSRALTDLENRINVRYRGDEDEVIQEIVAGNTEFSLPGSQFVGFNQGAKGLFGIKGTARLGGLTLTALASQEKGSGQKATFQAGAKETMIRRPDIEPLLGTYYFLDYRYRDRFPDRTFVPSDSIVSINLFVDDQRYQNDTEKAAVENAEAHFDPSNPSSLDTRDAHRGSFHELSPEEYYVNRAGGFIALNVSLGPKDVLGAVYRTAEGDVVGSMPTPDNPETPLIMKLIKPMDPRPEDRTWRYELRSVYYLGSRNIPPEGFQVRIFYDPPSGEDEYTQNGVDYLQILGLDRWGEIPGTPPDGNIDLNENYLNLARGELIFPDLEPFMNPDLQVAVDMYDTIARYELTKASHYYLEIKLSTRAVSYSLPATNILDGSEVVTLNGRRLSRGNDYQINYLTGEITFLTDAIKDPTADVRVDYEYSPLIQLEQKVLLGARAEYQLGQVGTISGMVLSRSERTLDRRVRLGREPSRMVVWDANAVLQWDPRWLTRAVDALPLIRTEALSRIDFEAEVARSIPDPNTTGEALVDDFEGAKNITGFGIGRGRWSPSSIPVGRTAEERARLIWYNPWQRVNSRDIWPQKETDIRSDRVNVLNLILVPNQPSPWPAGAYQWDTTVLYGRWNGVQQAVAAGAADLTQMQYLELWIQGYQGELHVDLGTISEDANGNGELNTEDLAPNGVRNGVIDAGEDIGLDGLGDEQELNFYILHASENPLDYPTLEEKKNRFGQLYSDPLWYSGRSPDDPASDNWRYTNPNVYTRVNGTENSKLDPDRQGRPDTEDINRNGYLDRSNNYVSYVINLSPESADSVYVAGGDRDPLTWREQDSWRLYRIPLTDVAETVGSPDLSLVQNVRLWVTGSPDTSAYLVSVANIDIVGNRWRERPVVVDDVTLPPETVRVSIRNTFDNAGEYTPPPGVVPVRDRITNLLRQEQSLAVTFSQIPAGVEGEVFRTIIKAEDFTQYRGIEMFMNARPIQTWVAGQDTSYIEGFLRFGADENNFYEYHTRVYPGWDERNHVKIRFDEITALKIALLDRWEGQGGVPDTTAGPLRVRGRPSLTNIRRLSIGVINRHPTLPIDGEIWADEMRVVDVRRDQGGATRIGFRAQIADLSTIDFRFSRRTADFHGLREKRGSLSTTTSTAFSWQMSLDRFTKQKWGLLIPLTFNWRHNRSLPKYLPGSDLVLKEGDKYQHQTYQSDQSVSISFRKQAPSESSLIAWTIDRMNLSFTGSRRDGRSPVNPINKSSQMQGSFGYDLSPTRTAEWHPLRLIPFLPRSLRETTFNPLPTRLTYSLGTQRVDEQVADRTGQIRTRYSFTATEQYRLGMRPLGSLRMTYDLNLNRDFTQGWQPSDLNMGREVRRRQAFDALYEPGTFKWMTQRYQYTAEYRENNDPRFNTRVTPEGEEIQLGRDVVSNVDANANYTIQPVQLLGMPKQLEGAAGLTKLINDIRRLVTNLTPVMLNFSQERTGNQYNLTGRPSLAYRFGLKETPDVVRAAAAATQQSTIRTIRRINLNSGVQLPLSAYVDMRPQWNWINRLSESKSTFSQTITWPAVSLQWSGLQKVWKFSQLTSAINLSSSYRRTSDKTDQLSDDAIGVRKPYSSMVVKGFQPLLAVQTTLNNGLGISLSRSSVVSLRQQLTGITSVTRNSNSNFRVDISYSFSAPQGIKIPFFKKPLRFTSNVDIFLGLVRSSEITEVRMGDEEDPESRFVPTNSKATWSLRPNVRYNFSRRVQGGFDMTIENIEDRMMGRTRKVREIAAYVNLFFN